jgi:hypothetical protein
MNANHFSLGILAGAVLGAGITCLAVLPSRFEVAPENDWLGANREPLLDFVNPLADESEYTIQKRRGMAIIRGHDFVAFHSRLPGREVLADALSAYEELLREMVKLESEKAKARLAFSDSVPIILDFQTAKLSDVWVKFASEDPQLFINKYVHNALLDSLLHGYDFDYWKRAGAL